jgi:hypothetical protein
MRAVYGGWGEEGGVVVEESGNRRLNSRLIFRLRSRTDFIRPVPFGVPVRAQGND